jgi:hypothetical protein
MSHSTRKGKRARISAYNPGQAKHGPGSSSMVVLTPTRTRRGKVIYAEADAAPYYKSSDEEGKSPKRKLPKIPTQSTATVLGDEFGQQDFYLDDQEIHIPRVTKVRLICGVSLLLKKISPRIIIFPNGFLGGIPIFPLS